MGRWICVWMRARECVCVCVCVCLGPYQLRRAFKHFDRDYSGSITVHEFTHVMRNFGYPSSQY